MDWVLLFKIRIRLEQGIQIEVSQTTRSRIAGIVSHIWLLGLLWAFLNLSIGIVAVDEGLKVANFDHLSLLALIFNQRIDLDGIRGVRGEQVLDLHIVKQLILSQTQDFKSLIPCNEAALNSQTLFSDLFAACIGMFLGYSIFLAPVIVHLLHPLLNCQRSYVLNLLGCLIIHHHGPRTLVYICIYRV